MLVMRFNGLRDEEGDVRCVLSSFQLQTIHSSLLVNRSIAQSSSRTTVA
jgi:hypothetical protein